MTEFRLLGPFEAIARGRPVELPVGKPRALLARLLLEADRVVPADALVEDLWGDDPPASARKMLHVYISQLRKALGAATIETRAPGYLLRIARDEYDLGRFELLTEAARNAEDAAARAHLLGEALSLWRGPALEEFRREPFVPQAARRLADLHLAVLGQRIEAELERGQHEEVIAELETLVEREPLREQPRRQLMLALYRAGRQADALARYRAFRHDLVEELGIEPSPALQELERAILRHDPSLDHGTARRSSPRGCVVCAVPDLHPLCAPLCADGRELLLVELVGRSAEVAPCARRLEDLRKRLTVPVRTACFTSTSPAADLARFAAQQEAELLVLDGLDAPRTECDVVLVPNAEVPFAASGPVVVPFGGGREEWAALELAAWLARAHELPLRLLGTEAEPGRRDASRTLAAASLALQRFGAPAAEPVIVPAGAEGILAQAGSAIVAAFQADRLDPTRTELVEQARVPVLLVRGGPRPSGLAPDQTLTRFSWSLADR
jgi:DNA-binding SARP family transcriptional activator